LARAAKGTSWPSFSPEGTQLTFTVSPGAARAASSPAMAWASPSRRVRAANWALSRVSRLRLTPSSPASRRAGSWSASSRPFGGEADGADAVNVLDLPHQPGQTLADQGLAAGETHFLHPQLGCHPYQMDDL